MKLLILSDSHGYLHNARAVLDRIGRKMQAVVHLGDHVYDAVDLQSEYPELPFYVVKGNNDFGAEAPKNLMLTIGGKKLLLTHGHMQQVYWSYDTISYWAEEQGADVVLFGHTHSPVWEEDGRVALLNPGSISMPRGVPLPTFGILELREDGHMECAIMEVVDRDTFVRKNP